MSKTRERDASERATTARHTIRLPGFVGDHDVGLGEVVKKATAYVGLRPCGGCERRASALNRWLRFSK